MSLVIIGLGSNVGDRARFLAEAIRELSACVASMEYSPIYTSAAVLPENAPAEWDMPYYNMVVRGDSALTPDDLLREAKSIEKRLGRTERGFWGPREIDVDILAYDDVVYMSELLTIPHPRLLSRNFALKPLADIAPGWRYPAPGPYQGRTAIELSRQLETDESFRPAGVTLPLLR